MLYAFTLGCMFTLFLFICLYGVKFFYLHRCNEFLADNDEKDSSCDYMTGVNDLIEAVFFKKSKEIKKLFEEDA